MKTKEIGEIYDRLEYAKEIVSISPKESIKISSEIYELAIDKEYKLLEGDALLNIVLYNRIKSDITSMLKNTYNALAVFKNENNTSGQIKSFNLIGIAYFYSSMYEEALKYFLNAKELLKTCENNSILIRVLNNMGEVYRESELYNDAMYYFNMAIDLLDKENNPVNHSVILLNIGEIYFDKGEFGKALEFYNKSYKILLNTDDMVFIGDIENKIGKLYFEMGDFDKAEKYYLQAYERLEIVDNKYYLIEVLINLGQIYDWQSNNKTIEFYEKGIYLAETIGTKKKLCKLYNLLSEQCEKEGDYKKALLYNKKYFNINEVIKSTSLKNKLEILNIGIKNSDNQDEIENIIIKLEKEIEKQSSEIKRIKTSNTILEKKVYEDELTGIANRRSINIYLNEYLTSDNFADTNIVLFMIDIDKFKKYNDYWGHSEGDNCIKQIANCIKKIQLFYGDKFARYGGEEFIYISNSKNYEEADKLGNLIRTEVEKLGLYYIDANKKKSTTISVGGIIGEREGFSSVREIIELADEELYRAKNMGRNISVLKEYSSIGANSIIYNQKENQYADNKKT